MDSLEDENALVELDLADRFRAEATVVGGDVSGLQPTAEGTGQSPRGSRDDVVQRRRHRLELVGVASVMGSDLTVDAERRPLAGRHVGNPKGAPLTDDAHTRPIDDAWASLLTPAAGLVTANLIMSVRGVRASLQRNAAMLSRADNPTPAELLCRAEPHAG